jgi:Tfp pilus assembly protein PilF
VRRAVLRGLKAQPEERFASMEALLTALVPSSRRVSTWAAAALVAVLLSVAAVYGLAWRRETRCAQEVAKLGPAWGPERRERVHAAFLATGAPYAALAWEKLSAVLDAHAAQWRTLRTEACLATDRDMTTEAWQVEACLDARVWQFVAVVEVLEKADARTVQRASQLAASLEGLSGCRDASPASARPQPPDALRARVDEARRKLAQAQASLEGARYAEGLQVTTALLADIRGLGFQPLDAEVLLTHGKLLANTDKLKEAEDSLYKAVWAAEAVHDDETAARAWIFVLWVVGDPMARPADAERIAQHAQAALQRLGPERFPSVAMDLNLYLSAVLIQQRKLDQAEAEINQGLSLARRTYGDDDLRTARFLHALGRVRYRQYRTEEALALNRQALAVRERLLGPAHPDLIHSLNNLANVYNMMGHVDEALAQLHRVLAIQEAAAPVDETSLSETLHNLGRTQRLAGQIDKARESLKRALPLLERLYGHDHPRVASNISVMALVEFDANHLDEALALATDALERTRRALGPETVRAEAPLQYRARIHLKAGRLREARRDFEEALTLLAKEQGPDGPGTSGIYINMSGVDMEEGKPRDALNRCQRALALDEKAQGPDAQIVAVELCCIAEAKLALGAADEAEPLLERARNIHQLRSGEYVNAAWTSFLLARALWEKRVAPDRARAAALAQEARTKLEALGLKGNAELAKVIAWQRARGLI